MKKNNNIRSISANHIIIAAGAFDTTQLLFDSHIRPTALGKYLHFHPLYMAQLKLKSTFYPPPNIPDETPRVGIYPSDSKRWFILLLRDIFPKLGQEVVAENQLLDLQIFISMDVQEQNRMILSSGKPNFDVRLSKQDQTRLNEARNDIYEIAHQLGTFRKGVKPNLFDFGFTHPMGMCRMGLNPETSVADHFGKVHGFKNLFIATVGLIPNSIAVNPTLTASAIAIATTEAISKIH